MTTTPLAERTRIVLVGLRNAGKSSLMNRMLGREASIISETPGTTTDPVTRSMELGELGPVAITDTAGLDDEGELGAERIRRSAQRAAAADLLIFVTPGDRPAGGEERQLLERLRGTATPMLFVRSFADREASEEKRRWTAGSPAVDIDSMSGRGMEELFAQLQRMQGQLERERTPLEGLVSAGDLVLLVTPIDSAAPKGRLILPQAETVRDALDRGCASLVVREHELAAFYRSIGRRPALVVTDSQAFRQVAAELPAEQPLTSFSILFARKKWDLPELISGLRRLREVPAGGRVLVMESCSHHRQEDDIGTVKIPRLFRRHVREEVEFDFARSLPREEELQAYSLIIHCAGCMAGRGAMGGRLAAIRRAGVPVTNYGLFLGWVNGLIPRALEPLPEAEELTALWKGEREAERVG
jgi:[FeFe] hydrogenase H-cluster maturation GTPase HydF